MEFQRPYQQTAQIEIWHPEPPEMLTIPFVLKDNFTELVELSGLTLLPGEGIRAVSIEPGLSLTCQLIQSGILAHTWPEDNYLSMMIQICDPNIDLREVARISEELWTPKKILFHQFPDDILRQNIRLREAKLAS